MLRVPGLLLIVVLLSACGANPTNPATATPARTLTVAAAANLTPAFTELGALFQAQTGIPVVFNFGSTGQLAQQIERGAPFDLFYAADQSFIEALHQKGLVLPDTMEVYAQGRLTLWTRSDSPLRPERIEDLLDPAYARIALANPETAPYGQAAKNALETAGVWTQLEPRFVYGQDIAQTLTLADTGNVEVALIALSLSMQSTGQWTLIPAELHADDPLIQMAAVITGTPNEAAARQFSAFVNSPEGRTVMTKYGFGLPGERIP